MLPKAFLSTFWELDLRPEVFVAMSFDPAYEKRFQDIFVPAIEAVEIQGENTLAASCIRMPTDGMVVQTNSERAKKSQEMVFELLASDMPACNDGPDPQSDFWKWADRMQILRSRSQSAMGWQ